MFCGMHRSSPGEEGGEYCKLGIMDPQALLEQEVGTAKGEKISRGRWEEALPSALTELSDCFQRAMGSHRGWGSKSVMVRPVGGRSWRRGVGQPDIPPSASQAPHTGRMGLSGTFQVSLAVPEDPGPGKWDKGQLTLLLVASNGNMPWDPVGKFDEESSGKANVLLTSQVGVWISPLGGFQATCHVHSQGAQNSTSPCTHRHPHLGCGAKGTPAVPSPAEPVLWSRGDSERGPYPCWAPAAGTQLDLMGQSPFSCASSLPPTASLRRQAAGEDAGRWEVGDVSSAYKRPPGRGPWRRALHGHRRHAHSQLCLAPGQGLPQGGLRAGCQAGRSHHGKGAAGARWPAWAGSAGVSPEG